MDYETLEKCMAKALVTLTNEDEGVVVEDKGVKYVVYTTGDAVNIEKITTDDDCIVQNLSAGQIVYLDK